MMSLSLLRPSRRSDIGGGDGASSRLRLEVCPPSLLDEEPEPRFSRCLQWLHTRRPVRKDTAAQRLREAREEFALALDGIGTQHADFLQHRLRHIKSMRELWHARPEMFGLIATHFTESEAECRMTPLNRHFPTRSPGSGFTPLA